MKTKKISALANAKINLELDVLCKRSDGYHNISTVFQSVNLADEVTVEVGKGNSVTVTTEGAVIEGENLVTKAANLFLEKINTTASVYVFLKKNIPLSAGLAGGSADAAAVLKCLNFSFNGPLDTAELLNLALQLGADVPFCLLGGTYLAEGIGEKLTPINYIGEFDVVLIKHHKKGSTGEMYSRIDSLEIPKLLESESILNGIDKLQDISPRLSYNSFLYASNNKKEQEELCKLLIEKGAVLAGLSGSGPTVFGLFKCLPNSLIESLKKDYNEVYVCKTSPYGIKIIE